MKLWTHTVLIVLILSGIVHAAELRGIIWLNELGGSVIDNVELSADGAAPTVSESDGRFRLAFPHKKPGHPVKLIASKDGLVVVHYLMLEHNLPEQSDMQPVNILMCTPQEKQLWALHYFRLKSTKTVSESYKQRLDAIRGNLKTTAANLANLERERDQALKSANRLAEQLANLQKGEESELYENATKLILDGHIDQALDVLDVGTLKARRDKLKEKAEQTSREFRLRGKLLSMKYRFNEAIQMYKEAVALTPNSFEAHFELAGLYWTSGRFAEARLAISSSLEVAEDDVATAMALSGLGTLNLSENRYTEAHDAFEGALRLYRKLSKDIPNVYLPHVADTLLDLGTLDINERYLSEARNLPSIPGLIIFDVEKIHFEEAREAFDEALCIQRELAEQNPSVYLPKVAMALHNLTILDLEENRLEEAREALNEAICIQQELAENDPSLYLPDVAKELEILGLLSRDEKSLEEARRVYEEVIHLQRALAKKNPSVYLPNISINLNRLGMLHLNAYDLQKEKALDGALPSKYKMADGWVCVHIPTSPGLLQAQSNLHLNQKHLNRAREALEEALCIQRELAEDCPSIYLPNVASVLHNLAKLDIEENCLVEARNALEEALRVRRMLADVAPLVYSPKVANTLYCLGDVHLREKHYREAQVAYKDSLRLYRELADSNPIYLPQIEHILTALTLVRVDGVHFAATCHFAGNQYKRQNRLEEALRAYEEELRIYREIYADSPSDAIASVLIDLGDLYKTKVRLEEASVEYEEALCIQRKLAEDAPSRYLPDVATTLHKLGVMYWNGNRLHEAQMAYEEALHIRRKLAEAEPTGNTMADVAATLHELGLLCLFRNHPDEAELLLKESLDIYKHMISGTLGESIKHIEYAIQLLHEKE